jgi:hypothetical protein
MWEFAEANMQEEFEDIRAASASLHSSTTAQEDALRENEVFFCESQYSLFFFFFAFV